MCLWNVARPRDTEHLSEVVIWASHGSGMSVSWLGRSQKRGWTESHQGISLSFLFMKTKNMFLRNFVRHCTLEAAGL